MGFGAYQGRIDGEAKGALSSLAAASANKSQKPGSGSSSFGLGLARVDFVNYEKFTVALTVISGDNDNFTRVPIPITFPTYNVSRCWEPSFFRSLTRRGRSLRSWVEGP
jgi:hypothetical protein